MPAGLYMDVHVPAAVTEGLRRRGVDVLTSQEDGTREWDDYALFARCAGIDRVVFTQDEDLLQIAARWQQDGLEFSGLVFSHQEGPSIGRIVEDLELIIMCSVSGELVNRVIHLPLR